MLPAQTQIIEAIFTDAVRELAHSAPSSDATDISITLERPKIAAHGDLASTVALQRAKAWGVSARRLAQQLADAVQAHPRACGLIESVEVAGPALSMCASPRRRSRPWLRRYWRKRRNSAGSRRRQKAGSACRSSSYLRILPGRCTWAMRARPYWGMCWRICWQRKAGRCSGNIITTMPAFRFRIWHCLWPRARGLQPGDAGWPDAAYHGEYIADIARDYLMDEEGKSDAGAANALEHIRLFAVAYLRREQDANLQALGVRFDQYYLESSLYRTGRVDATVQALCAAGKTYMREGALWLKTTEEGDDKDRVMRKSDGSYTYFVPDIAYHLTK